LTDMTGLTLPAHPLPLPSSEGAWIVCRPVLDANDLDIYRKIRHRVFVEEQALFTDSDLDEHDEDAAVIRLLGYCDGVAAGCVRLFVLDDSAALWQGDRLAVLAPYRTRGVGAPLVRCAVATAGERGGRTMIAHIQLANVAFFRRLGWAPAGAREIYVGRAHQPMTISLPTPEDGAAVAAQLAAGITSRDR
jgi:putative N-acetyltransferase (TIGR04045 family)